MIVLRQVITFKPSCDCHVAPAHRSFPAPRKDSIFLSASNRYAPTAMHHPLTG